MMGARPLNRPGLPKHARRRSGKSRSRGANTPTEALKNLVGKRVYDVFPPDGFLGLGLM